jgi:broad specificity phosphatase PhoE
VPGGCEKERLAKGTALIAPPVFLARHGETESNRVSRYAGRNGEPLTKRGRSQVLRLAEQLKGLGIRRIWSSAVWRALESATLLSDHLRLPLTIDQRLDEMRLGAWEGRTEAEVARDFPDDYALWLSQPDQVRMDGRETLAQVAARVMGAVADARASHLATLLMTHVAPIRVAVLSTVACPLGAYKRLTVGNAACVRLECATEQANWVPQGASLRAELERAGSVAA